MLQPSKGSGSIQPRTGMADGGWKMEKREIEERKVKCCYWTPFAFQYFAKSFVGML